MIVGTFENGIDPGPYLFFKLVQHRFRLRLKLWLKCYSLWPTCDKHKKPKNSIGIVNCGGYLIISGTKGNYPLNFLEIKNSSKLKMLSNKTFYFNLLFACRRRKIFWAVGVVDNRKLGLRYSACCDIYHIVFYWPATAMNFFEINVGPKKMSCTLYRKTHTRNPYSIKGG